MTPELAAQAKKHGVETVQQFGELERAQVDKILDGLPEGDKKDAHDVARSWPVVDVVGAKFEGAHTRSHVLNMEHNVLTCELVPRATVAGEKIVTPGAIVSFTLKLRLAPPGTKRTTPEVVSITHDTADEGDEQSVDELIGRRSKKDEGVVPTPLAHAPHFPKVRLALSSLSLGHEREPLADLRVRFPQNRKPAWHIFVGDHKLNRVFVAPYRFTDMGSTATRTVRMSFQAPPGPGLYTFQVYVASDSFVGTGAQKDMRMKVEPPRDDDDEGAEDDEDDISEPDEDSLAGQMALMKGQPVKRRDDDDEGSDDESETDSETDSESESSSDSDSDSD